MHKHQIFLSSSYSTRTRIGIHYADIDGESFSSIVRRIRSAYDGKAVPFSIHTVTTDSLEWESVVRTDPYFDDVKIMDSIDSFISLIQKDRYLSGLDVAKYILSLKSCTHTRLEKLTYMCYADYMYEFGEKLFVDEIYAFDYGPVIDSVYQRYSEQSRSHPSSLLDDDHKIRDIPVFMPMKSRIMFSEDGLKKIGSIDASLQRYDSYSTKELVEKTHGGNTPWSVTERITPYTKIDDEIIKKYHVNEM